MNIKINCDVNIDLKDYKGNNKLTFIVERFSLEKDTLNGFVEIVGSYLKQYNSNDYYVLYKEVPFTLVFKKDNNVINKIEIENFKYTEIINQGLECNFDILIDYEEKAVIPNMTTLEREKAYNTIISKNGIKNQTNKLIEEIGEFLVEVAKTTNGIGNRENLIKEFGDLMNMLNQLMIWENISIDELHYAMDQKTLRALERMKE